MNEDQNTTTVPQKIDDADRLKIDQAKTEKKLALANAEKAIAQNDLADMKYRNVVLELYVRYGLGVTDAINEDGTIIKNGSTS